MTSNQPKHSIKNSVKQTKDYRDGKKIFQETSQRGEFMDTCATIHSDYVCCNVKVLKSVSNCPFECSYCFLQNYLTNTTLSAVQNIDTIIQEVSEKIEAQPWRIFRIGTWELGDSLALEPDLGQAKKLVHAFKNFSNAFLELKTKSNNVSCLLGLDHQEKTIVSWSLNSPYIVQKEEHKTASFEARIKAMKTVVEDGYLVGAHFDPIIYYENWKKDYQEAIRYLFQEIPSNRFAWISMGSLRFNPEQRKSMQILYPGSPISSTEMSLGKDRKLRYVKPIRTDMYQGLYDVLKSHLSSETLFYLCMERWDMWDKILGYHPKSIAHLDYLFAKKLHERFPNKTTAPILELYEKHQNS